MKPFRFATLSVLLSLVALGTIGCGGVSASRSVSPATFFLPGLMKNDIQQPPPGTPTPPTPAEDQPASRPS